jgi:hypothetical protein
VPGRLKTSEGPAIPPAWLTAQDGLEWAFTPRRWVWVGSLHCWRSPKSARQRTAAAPLGVCRKAPHWRRGDLRKPDAEASRLSGCACCSARAQRPADSHRRLAVSAAPIGRIHLPQPRHPDGWRPSQRLGFPGGASPELRLARCAAARSAALVIFGTDPFRSSSTRAGMCIWSLMPSGVDGATRTPPAWGWGAHQPGLPPGITQVRNPRRRHSGATRAVLPRC